MKRSGFWLIAIAALFITNTRAISQETDQKAGEPIRVTSEQLIADDANKFAEFIGNVKAVQGTTVITSNSLKIHYAAAARDGNTGPEGKKTDQTGAIKKIIATGQVKIEFDGMVAESQEAVYTTDDRVLVLQGNNSTITKPDSGTISGSKITVYRDTGKIKFDGNVQGLFKGGDKGLN